MCFQCKRIKEAPCSCPVSIFLRVAVLPTASSRGMFPTPSSRQIITQQEEGWGTGQCKKKGYIIQGKMLPRVTILVTQIKTESSGKRKDAIFNLLEQQCTATLRNVVTPILDGQSLSHPSDGSSPKESANPPNMKRCWTDIGPQGPNLGYVLNTPHAWHLPWDCLNARGRGRKHH